MIGLEGPGRHPRHVVEYLASHGIVYAEDGEDPELPKWLTDPTPRVPDFLR